MKFNLNKKGFSFSPYLMIVMMFLGIIMAFHFIVVDSQKAVAIAQEGSTLKNALQVEGTKSAARNVILLSAYDYIDTAFNRPDLQVAPNVIGKVNPITNKMFTLKDYLEYYILYDLNNAASEGHTGGALGFWNDVKISENDDKGKPRKDGFLVSASGEPHGVPSKIEKFVDANVFNLLKYSNDENSDSSKGKFHYKLKDLMASKMQKTLSGVICKVEGIYNNWGRQEAGIACRNDAYTDEDPDVNDFCTDSPYQVTWGDRSSPCWENREVKPFMRDAGETLEKIKEALTDTERTIAKGDSNVNTIKAFTDDNITLKLEIKKITASTSVSCGNGKWCCKEGKKGACLRWDQDYIMYVTTTGSIQVEETFIAQAKIKENDSTKGSFEICYENPIMNKKGKVIPVTVKKEYTFPYSISISYRLDCPPSYLTVKTRYNYDWSWEWKECEAKKTSASAENIMTFTDKEESLRYTLETPKCDGGSIHPHVGGPDVYTGGAGLDVLTQYKGGPYNCNCWTGNNLD